MRKVLQFYCVVWCFLAANTRRVRDRAVADILNLQQVYSGPNTFCDAATKPSLQTLIINNGTVYVGATNAILQISANDFRLTNTYKTGPQNDSVDCTGPHHCQAGLCKANKNLLCVNNYNKILVAGRGMLIACGTAHRTCDLLQLDDVSQVYSNEYELKCAVPQHSILSVRNPNIQLTSAVYLNPAQPNGKDDLLYVGAADDKMTDCISDLVDINYLDPKCTEMSIKTYQAPRATAAYFKEEDDSKNYVQFGKADSTSFIYMWSTSSHVFTLRKSNNMVTRLSRACHKQFFTADSSGGETETADDGYATYIESEINCQVNYVTFTNATAAEYTNGNLFILFTNSSLNKHVICSSPLLNVNEKLDAARQSCLSDDPNKAAKLVNKYGLVIDCQNVQISKKGINCPISQNVLDHIFFEHIGGIRSSNPIAINEVVSFNTSHYGDLTGFVSAQTKTNTVFFVGTGKGLILKTHNQNAQTVVSEEITVSAKAILKDLRIDKQEQHVFGLTSAEVFRVKVENCESLTTCGACLSSNDPYCGWCIQQSACTSNQTCGQENVWVGFGQDQGKCPLVATFHPMHLSINSVAEMQLSFTGTALPVQSGSFTCRFTRTAGGRKYLDVSSILTNYPSTPSCSFSPGPSLPLAANENSDHVNVTLTIDYNGKVMAESAHSIIVYDCSLINQLNNQTMCSSCESSKWNCTWCIRSETCSNDTCTDGSKVNLISECPTVVGFADSPTHIIPYGVEKTFILNTSNLNPTLNGVKEFKCIYEVCGRTTKSQSTVNINSMTVECAASAQLLSCDREHYDVRIFLQRDNYVIDSPKPPTATVYNCEKNSRDCATCLQFRRKFSQCRWCNSTSKCLTANQCPAADAVTGIGQCAAPIIASILPLNGPVQGGTDVTIQGVNMGAVASDIVNVTIGNLPCISDPQRYQPSTTIVCKTTSAKTSFSSRVMVQTNYSRAVYSTNRFFYRIVTVKDIAPTEVISKAEVTVSGSGLNVGNSARIVVNGNSNTCSYRNETTLVCKSPETTLPGNYTAKVEVDGFTVTLKVPLEYFSIPRITQKADINSFSSGGRLVDIQLNDVRGVQTASLLVDGGKPQACRINRTSSVVSCPMPQEPRVSGNRKRRNVSPSSTTKRSYNVSIVLNGQQTIAAGLVKFQDNPQLKSISQLPCASATSAGVGVDDGNDTQSSAADTVVVQIQGTGFANANSKKTDYQVALILSSTSPIPCVVSFIEPSSLFCRAQAKRLKQYENNKIAIQVSSGNWTDEVPNVVYCKRTEQIFMYIIIPVAAVMLAVILILLVRYRVQKKKQKRERKLIMSKLDDLENKTRETARNAYYELQVGYMTNLTDNLSDRITYLPTTSYFTQTLFNKTTGHPVQDRTALQHEPVNTMEALNDWLLLLKKRDFLITFIRILEEQRRFTVQDKGSVASYLTACLLSDLPYYTKIMFELLSHLIEKHVAKNPKLLLRRSESVVEKMVSHWLSITLYDDCIKESAGKPIFLLTKSIHYLVSSAPCDVIANKAMNSLNEMTLLGSEISHETVILRACIDDGTSDRDKSTVEVKVVNVDTITQAKTKIIEAVYKDRPYSECPKPDDLQLELLSSTDRREGIVLSDIDATSEKDGYYTKLNTLKHYNVPNNATAILRPPGEETPASQDSKAPLLTNERRTLYHLIHPRDDESANGGIGMDDDNNSGKKANTVIDNLMKRPFQEMYLTRMVRAKTTLQEYVDGVFSAILCPKPLPKSVRYFFQYLDAEAAKHKVSDPEVIHIWKTNSLLLRYWVNVLKNPEFIYDTNKTAIVDTCLNVITQAFMDACTTSNRKLGHDSPSNKLLYAKDAEHYKVMVKEFFVNVSNTAILSEKEMNDVLRKRSTEYGGELNEMAAAQMLSSYLIKYREQVTDSLRENEKEHFAKSVEVICQKLGDSSCCTTMV
uniref:Plexin-B1 n=1 Tax=Phallusia mammillata TaxID=59560 RepID=A0A6F9DPJ9_9ASCI|nr:plexin-B1 [Phallusia mammillata]